MPFVINVSFVERFFVFCSSEVPLSDGFTNADGTLTGFREGGTFLSSGNPPNPGPEREGVPFPSGARRPGGIAAGTYGTTMPMPRN